jgi:hypothetical protein
MKLTRSDLSAVLCAAAISAVFLAGTADAQAKGGSPSWHGLTPSRRNARHPRSLCL